MPRPSSIRIGLRSWYVADLSTKATTGVKLLHARFEPAIVSPLNKDIVEENNQRSYLFDQEQPDVHQAQRFGEYALNFCQYEYPIPVFLGTDLTLGTIQQSTIQVAGAVCPGIICPIFLTVSAILTHHQGRSLMSALMV